MCVCVRVRVHVRVCVRVRVVEARGAELSSQLRHQGRASALAFTRCAQIFYDRYFNLASTAQAHRTPGPWVQARRPKDPFGVVHTEPVKPPLM